MKELLVKIAYSAALLIIGGALGFILSGPINDVRLLFSPAPTQSSASEAWDDFTRRIDATGRRILGEGFPNQTDRQRAEGIRQLAHVIGDGLRWEFDRASSEFTGLLVNNTDLSGWGGPNVDNKYLRARIDGQSTYLLTGNTGSLFDVAIQTNKGDLHMGEVGASPTMDLSALAVDEYGNFTVTISPEPHEGNWIQQGDDHTILSVRAYYLDWNETGSGRFFLVKEGHEGLAPAALTEAEAAQHLANAAHWIETNVIGWNQWLKLALVDSEDNQPNGPRRVGGGSSTLLYGSIPFSLDPDMALVIEVDDPEAHYFSFQTYTLGWFDAGDYANRQTSLNNAQTRTGSDGRIRIVASAMDPGVPNWIDVEGRQKGLIVFRYMRAANPQQPLATLVPISAVRKHLPADTPVVTEEERRSVISMRQRHVQHRFHN